MTSGKHNRLMAVCLGISKDMPSLFKEEKCTPDIRLSDGIKNMMMLKIRFKKRTAPGGGRGGSDIRTGNNRASP